MSNTVHTRQRYHGATQLKGKKADGTDIRDRSGRIIIVKDRIRNLQPCCFGEWLLLQINKIPSDN